jgi:hypothetical protein
MPEPWSPSLSVDEEAGVCRLSLGGLACGYGDSLQAAADDLVASVRALALGIRRGGLRVAPDAGPPDVRLLELGELGELAARGRDIRARVLGGAPEPGA